MKKPLYLILLLIFTLVMPVNTYAAFPENYPLGLSKAYIEQVTGVDDIERYPDKTGTIYTYEYRKFSQHPKRIIEEKPTAQFAVYVNGEKRAVSNADYDLDAPTTVCDVNIDDKVEIRDCSTAYPGNILELWDFQYRIIPDSGSVNVSNFDNYRKQHQTKPKILTSAKAVNEHFQNVIWNEVKDLAAKNPNKQISIFPFSNTSKAINNRY